MSCLSAPKLPTSLPVGLTLGVPKVGIGVNLGINLCCHFNVPIAVSTDDVLALLAAAGISVHAIPLTANLLKPIQTYLIAANKFLDKLQLNCPFDGT